MTLIAVIVLVTLVPLLVALAEYGDRKGRAAGERLDRVYDQALAAIDEDGGFR